VEYFYGMIGKKWIFLANNVSMFILQHSGEQLQRKFLTAISRLFFPQSAKNWYI